MIVLKSSENAEWPWANAGVKAEAVFTKVIFGLYGLGEAEVRLLRATAPPRDPLALAEAQLTATGRVLSGKAREAG